MRKFVDKKSLILFEDKIANYFNNSKIKAPVHLSSDNEENLLQIFNLIGDED